jgi:putative zinc finger protein
MTTDHLSFEQLNELADGDLASDVRASVERHIAGCAVCRGELSRLRALIERAGTLPASIGPPAEAWAGVRGRLRRHAGSAPRRFGWIRDWGLRAAAAVVLVAGSSALTMLLRARTPANVPAAPTSPTTAPAVPTAVRAVDRSYAEVLDELTVTIRAQRGALTPETIATLERTLRVIDEAIAEARAALAADPGNGALLDVLSANYEQKVQLLRRVSELPART